MPIRTEEEVTFPNSLYEACVSYTKADRPQKKTTPGYGTRMQNSS